MSHSLSPEQFGLKSNDLRQNGYGALVSPGCFGWCHFAVGGTLVLCHGRPLRDQAVRLRVGLPWHLRGPGPGWP
eukprot:7239946-Alexandrium_andersonii.AAC.1